MFLTIAAMMISFTDDLDVPIISSSSFGTIVALAHMEDMGRA